MIFWTVLVLNFFSHSQVVSSEKIDLLKFSNYVEAHKTSDLSCIESKELKSVYFCLFEDLKHLKLSLGRASLFKEAGLGLKEGSVLLDLEKLSHYSIAGLNLSSKDLLAFREKACAELPQNCLTKEEHFFYENVVSPIQKNKKSFYIVGLDKTYWHKSLAHEAWHAYYFSDLKYKKAVQSFWGHLPAATQSEVKSILSGDGSTYGNVESVLIDELQAYCNTSSVYDIYPNLHPFCLKLYTYFLEHDVETPKFLDFL